MFPKSRSTSFLFYFIKLRDDHCITSDQSQSTIYNHTERSLNQNNLSFRSARNFSDKTDKIYEPRAQQGDYCRHRAPIGV